MIDEKCKNCGRQKGKHKALDYNCPFGRGSQPQYYIEQFFEPQKKRVKTKDKPDLL